MSRRGLRLPWILASACAPALVALSAAAQGPGRGAGGGVAAACASDAGRLCPGARGVDLLLCLDERRADLGPTCRAKVAERAARIRERHALVAQACKDEAARFCPDVEPGPGGGLVRCLRARQAELSEPCRVQLAAHEPR
jgi:hypothetical protein